MSLPPLQPWTRLDLHMHSDRSDGRYSVDEVLRRAVDGGLDVIALTDHDLPAQAPAGRICIGGKPIHVVHGAEISGVHEGIELHLLVYFGGEMPQAFRDFCTALAAKRAERYEQARENLGVDLPAADDAAQRGERSLTRLHLSRSLVDHGHAKNLSDAFMRFTGDRHGNVPHVELTFLEAIAVAKAHGGITSWAHPYLEHARKWTKPFAASGLDALEGLRPGLGKKTRRTIARLARNNDLFLTGGSDFHGWSPQRLGDFAVQGQQATGFARALQHRAVLAA
ncbi:MAG: PHP domain-containing protein [Proteobacteria bacterium]|nr:PHP domain-containing protein [Pseudomonadota bacterium]MCP4920772.1 PHP domain-containing protein [Pseudomonadota bacterium]